jgi:precorrin-2 dehydrogenase/sirohydrochlorin ferrochelatase
MKTYPIFALIGGKPCLVVGGGAVGERKVQDLLTAGARVTVVSQTLTPYLEQLANRGEIRYLEGVFTPDHLEGMSLVIGATDDHQVNIWVSAAAQERGIWVNIVDAPELCTFIVPAQVRRGDLTIAVSTGGASPALARRLREALERRFGPEYGPYLVLLQEVRERVLAVRRSHPDNAALFLRLVDSPLHEALAQGDRDRVGRILEEVLGEIIPSQVLGDLVDKAFSDR